MRNYGVKDFFYRGNAVHGELDYGLADNFVRTAEAFANTLVDSVLTTEPQKNVLQNKNRCYN